MVAVATMLVLSALSYAIATNREDVFAATVAELLLVGALVVIVRLVRARRTSAPPIP